jgi:hypothetical protein
LFGDRDFRGQRLQILTGSRSAQPGDLGGECGRRRDTKFHDESPEVHRDFLQRASNADMFAHKPE